MNTQGTDGDCVTTALPEVVYFMYSAGKIKIGRTKNIDGRLGDLSRMAGAPVELIALSGGNQ